MRSVRIPLSPPSQYLVLHDHTIHLPQEERAQEFKSKFIAYLETLMHMQQEV